MLVVAIRFLVGFGNVGSVAMGMSSLGTPRFTLLNLLGALLWATVLALAGYLLGDLLELVLEEVEAVEKPLLVGIVIVTVGWIVWHHVRSMAEEGLWRPRSESRSTGETEEPSPGSAAAVVLGKAVVSAAGGRAGKRVSMCGIRPWQEPG
jgi:hypothetical protein